MKCFRTVKHGFDDACITMYVKAKHATSVILMALLTLMGGNAFAQNAGQIGENIAGSGTGITTAILTIFGVVGVLLVGVGLIKWKNAKQTNEPMGGIIGMIIIGALLLSITGVIGVIQMSTFGTNEAQNTLDTIVQ